MAFPDKGEDLLSFKIKCQPEDFVVEEISDLPLAKEGPFAVYTLKKKNWSTGGVLLELAKKFRKPLDDFSFGGKPDRDGVTSQSIAIEGPRTPDWQGVGYSLVFAGLMDRPMGPDLVRENRFRIVVRGLEKKDAEAAVKTAETVREHGFPNYFDEQRFGGLDLAQGFLAEKLLKDQQNGAVKIYLTSVGEEDLEEEKVRKAEFVKRWKDWKSCLEVAKTNIEKTAFHFLMAKRTGMMDILRDIPKSELSMHLSSYQAFLWNEMVRRILKEKIKAALTAYPGKAGDYLFYERLEPEVRAYFTALALPTASSKASMPDALSRQIYDQIFLENGVENIMFNKMKVRQAYFKSVERPAVVVPGNFSVGSAADELEEGCQKLTLNFSLPRGSYGTMLLKRIFFDSK